MLVIMYIDVQQLEFQCDLAEAMTWSNAGGVNFGVPNGGTLMTPLRTDCGLCLTSSGAFPDRWDNITHCISKKKLGAWTNNNNYYSLR